MIALVLKGVPYARPEAELLLRSKGELRNNILLIDKENSPLIQRLSGTRIAIDVLADSLEGAMRVDWQSIIKTDFCVVAPENIKRNLAGIIWNSLEHPDVNLRCPGAEIHAIEFGTKILIGLKSYENKDKPSQRRAHKRPVLHPSSLDPALAKAMVNMSRCKTIHDPFCGTGGILIEAGLIGLKSIGSDIDPKMIEGSRKNLEHFKIKAKLEVKDAFKIKKRIDHIVTDLPYLKNTKGKESDRKDFVNSFLRSIPSILGKRAVVGLPGDIRINIPKELVKVADIKFRVHRSMVRRIIVLDRC